MKALYKYSIGEKTSKLTERPVPEISAPDDVLVKVKAVAVCGMDVHIYHGKFECTPPFIMGHEFVGRVEKTGSKVQGLDIGDRVVAEPHHHACGKCNTCLSGAPQSCEDKISLGISRDGAMAEYIVVPSRYLHKVPESIPNRFAVLIEPMTIVISDFERGGFKKGDSVAIIGAGQIALLAVVAAKAAGASKIIVTGQEADIPKRFKAARALGADYTLSAKRNDIFKTVMEITNNKGVDMIFEASGSEEGINTAIDIVRICGKMALLGLTKKERISVDWDKLMKKMVNLQFNMMSDYKNINKSIELFANPPCDLSPLVTHESPLEDWESIFCKLTDGEGIKAVLYI